MIEIVVSVRWNRPARESCRYLFWGKQYSCHAYSCFIRGEFYLKESTGVPSAYLLKVCSVGVRGSSWWEDVEFNGGTKKCVLCCVSPNTRGMGNTVACENVPVHFLAFCFIYLGLGTAGQTRL